MSYAYKIVNSPVGKLKLVAKGTGLVAILWENERPNRVRLGEMGVGVDDLQLGRGGDGHGRPHSAGSAAFRGWRASGEIETATSMRPTRSMSRLMTSPGATAAT